MDIDRKNAERPLRRLRKALKRLPNDPSAEQVHTLRTQTRRIEAVVDALPIDKTKKKARRLLKAVTPVRKAAGDVRDVDVLVGKVLALSSQHDEEALTRLVEHLAELRVESARELRQTVTAHCKSARESLKDYAHLLARQFQDDRQVVSSAMAPAGLAAELSQWPKLDQENIHSFRIKIKHLRYMLQLSNRTDPYLMDSLNRVKNEVGDWHDWQELATIARQVLDSKADAAALARIDEIGSKKLKHALSTANAFRERYFSNGEQGKRGRAISK